MDVKAIIVVGPHSDASPESHSEQITGAPYALADVLGKPLVYRAIDRLKHYGIDDVTVVADAPTEQWPIGTAVNGRWICGSGEQLWKAVEQVFTDTVEAGAELVLLVRLGAYAELDYKDLLSFHFDRNAHITSVMDGAGVPLDVYVLSASRRNEAAFMIRHQLRQFRNTCDFYSFTGYINRLSSPNHLRQLAIEGLMQRIQLEPEGEQVKPGVWLGRG